MIIEEIIRKFWVKVAFAFGLGGFVVSFLLVLIFGGGFPDIIIRPILSGIFMSVVWITCYFLIVKFAPDILALFGISNNNKDEKAKTLSGAVHEDEDFNFELNIDGKKSLTDEAAATSSEYENLSEDLKLENAPGDKKQGPAKVKRKAGSDEIMVDGIPMKKDPELMARAIQHVLDTDKD